MIKELLLICCLAMSSCHFFFEKDKVIVCVENLEINNEFHSYLLVRNYGNKTISILFNHDSTVMAMDMVWFDTSSNAAFQIQPFIGGDFFAAKKLILNEGDFVRVDLKLNEYLMPGRRFEHDAYVFYFDMETLPKDQNERTYVLLPTHQTPKGLVVDAVIFIDSLDSNFSLAEGSNCDYL